MIMTHTEEVSMSFESKMPSQQINGHATNGENQEGEEPGSTGVSPTEVGHPEGTTGSSVLAMGSTDSAGSAHSGSSCGLVSSLFPSSCRGRAEAFARRLHRRLTSLGGEDRQSTSEPKETSWLHTSTGTRTVTVATANNNSTGPGYVLQRQPRHSPESDLYYDFDLDEDTPGSPAEEATAAELADILVNPRILKSNHHDGYRCSPGRDLSLNQDPESGCVFASPITGTSPESDTSELYFDPDSSETEKTKNEVYFDPVSTTSDSEATTNLSNGYKGKLAIPGGRKRMDNGLDASEDTTDSSCSSKRNNCLEKARSIEDGVLCSSEDSSNGRSSLETTSPSHESLWSTFDESTMSLQDETPSRITSSSVTQLNKLPKSHSDSEIPMNGTRLLKKIVVEADIDEVDFVNGPVENGLSNEDLRNGINVAKDSSDCSDEAEEDLPLDDETSNGQPSKASLNLVLDETPASDTDTDHSTYSSTINIPGALTLECSTGERVLEPGGTMKNEVKLQIENGAVLNGTDEDKMCLLLQKLSTSPAIKEDALTPTQEAQTVKVEEEDEEEEEEEERPQKVRRCSSLKTGKTPPGTPGRKKIVRFADVLGLDLADVRTFLDEIPKIPNSAYSDLIYDDIFQKDSSPVNSLPSSWGSRYADSRRGSGCAIPRKLDRTLVPLFQQPGGMPSFLDLVRERRVCLENVVVEDPVSLSIQGTVRVINLDFHKSVHIRYTLNSWKNYSDLQASYVPNSCDGFSDKFSFVLYCHTIPVGQKLEFAVRFQCKGAQYWDNNAGANYCFQCLPASSSVGYIPITATSETQSHEWSPMFY